jgi:chromosome partitioning protein
MKRIAFVNRKGGVGKTTSAVNVACGLARSGSHVLLVDLDEQGDASLWTGATNAGLTVRDVIQGDVPIRKAIVHSETVDVLPSDSGLATLRDVPLDCLRKAMRGLSRSYDFVIYDCPRALAGVTFAALVACDDVFIPIQADLLSLPGLDIVMTSVDQVREKTSSKVSVKGFIVTNYDGRKSLSKQVVDSVTQRFDKPVFKVRTCVALAEAPGYAQSIFDYAPRSNGAADYGEIVRAILEGA